MSWTDLPGWCDFTWLYEEWAKAARKDAVFVEVGVYLGRSFAFMGECLMARPDVQMWAVDNWAVNQPRPPSGGPHWEGWGGDSWPDRKGDPRVFAASMGGPFNSFVAGMRHCARETLERAHILRMPSAPAARVFDDRSVDFVYIDADHSYEGCLADIKAWLPKVRPGGLIAGHDHATDGYPGVVRACRETWGESLLAESMPIEAHAGYMTKGVTWMRRIA